MSVFRSLLMLSAVIPEPDIYPYLLASRSGNKLIKLLASKIDAIYYSNIPQVLENTLDNKDIGSSKFSFSFKINKNIITSGTKYVLNYPGLIDVKTEDNTLWFKFLYKSEQYWRYTNSAELVNDWNKISLEADGNGLLTLTINDNVHTLFGGAPKYTVINYPVKTESDQTILDQILSSDTWTVSDGIIKNIKVSDSSGSAYTHFSLHTTAACSFAMKVNISSENNYDFGAVYIGSDIYKPTQSQLKSKQTDGNGNYLVVGSGTSLEGGTGTYVNDNGDIAMNLEADTDYIVSFAYAKDSSGSSGDDCIKISEFYTSATSGKYPEIKSGILKLNQSWLYLKDIKAVKIEDTESSDTTKIEDAIHFEHTESDLHKQKFDLHTKNKIAAGNTAIAYLDNPSDIYDNQYDFLEDFYNNNGEAVPALIYTEDGLAYWLISNTKFALHTRTVYGKLKPFYYNSNNEKVYLEENNINYRFKRKKSNYDNVEDTEVGQYYKLFPEYIYTCIMPPIMEQSIDCCYLNQNKDSIMNYSSEQIVNYYKKYRNLSITIVGDSKITLCAPPNVQEYDIISYGLSIEFQYKDDNGETQSTSIGRGYILDAKL